MTGYQPPRQERHENGSWCDKAWHLDAGKGPVAATCVLRCAFCPRVYARCAECNAGVTSAATSMRAHVATCRWRVRRWA